MKYDNDKSPVSNIGIDPDETGFSINLGRFEVKPFGTVIETRTGAVLGRIQHLSPDSLSPIVQAARSAWLNWLAAPAARMRRAA